LYCFRDKNTLRYQNRAAVADFVETFKVRDEMLDFETVCMKHSESLIQQIVETWERYNGVRHARPMMLEERWEHFIRATEPFSAVAA
jgi:hypothetical protein